MNNNYTSIEQSKHLLELGLNPATADMYYSGSWTNFNEPPHYTSVPSVYVENRKRFDLDIPAWSVGQLLSLMPKHYAVEKTSDNEYACYMMTNPEEFGKSPIEVAYKKIVFLLENKLI